MKEFGLDPDKCLNCGMCEEKLPHIFYAGDGVMNQPETEEEKNFCLELMKSCPAGAIYNEDGIMGTIAGEITHLPKAVNIIKRPPDSELGAYCDDCEDKEDGCENECPDRMVDLVSISESLPDVKSIVKNYLEMYGYYGLYRPDLICGCFTTDLMPCDVPSSICAPGHKIIYNSCNRCDEHPDGCIGEKGASCPYIDEDEQ